MSAAHPPTSTQKEWPMTDRTRTLALMAASLYPSMVQMASDEFDSPVPVAMDWAITRAQAILAEVERREAQQASGVDQ